MRRSIALLGAAATVLTGVAVATPANAAASQASYAFIASSRQGSVVYVNGLFKQGATSTTLSNSADRVVYLQRFAGGTWQNLVARHTGVGTTSGHLTVGFTQTASYSYRWVAPATATAGMATSAATTPPKYTAQSTYLFIASSRKSTVVYVNGLVKQGASTSTLQNATSRVVYLQRYSGGAWHNLVARRTGAAGTSLAGHVTVGFAQPGLFHYRWVALPISGAAGAVSALTTPPAYVAPAPPVSAPPAPPAPPADVYYANCHDAWAAGAAPLYRGDPGYRAGLDRDGDGIACEQPA